MGNKVNGLGVNGDVKFMVKTAGKAMLLALLVLVRTFQACSGAPSLVLHYDDGGAECFWSDYYPNGVAVKFTAPSSRWRITSILIYGFVIDRGVKTFIVEVRDSDFNLVFKASCSSSEHFKNATLGWARISLPGIIVRGDFYVCVYPMLELNGTQLWIAVDNDTISDRSFLVDCYRQEMEKYDGGIAMIGVEGEEAADSVKIVPDSIFAEEKALRLFFRVLAESNVTEVKAILQTGLLTEDCEVVYKEGLYEVMVDCSRLSGLREPAELTLSARASDSITFLTVKLGETLFSAYFRLMGENALLKTMLNSSRPECEVLEDKLGNKEASIIALRSLLNAYEERLLEEAFRIERLCVELNILRILTVLLAASILFLLLIVLRRRLFASSTLSDAGERGGRRRLEEY